MTSSVMFAYSIYLCQQVASIRPSPGADEQDLPTTMRRKKESLTPSENLRIGDDLINDMQFLSI